MKRILVSILLLTTLFNFGCSKQKQQKKASPKVIVCPVTQQKVHPTDTMVGQVVALEKVALRARITGFIEKQPVENGAFVKKGDIIFLIQKIQYEAEVLSAQGNLEKAQATLENATINYNRQKYLAAKQAVSQRDFDLAAANLGDAQGGLKLAQADLIEAKLNLSYTEIIAPFDGKIGIAAYDPGNLVSPDSGVLVEIVMLDPVFVQFNLIEQNLLDYIEKKYSNKNLANKPNKITLAERIAVKLILSNGQKYPLTGKIEYSDNVIDSLTGSILLRAIFKNSQRMLIPGAYVNVILERKDPLEALLVPQDAVQMDQVGSFVYVLEKNNTVKYTSVIVGAVYGIGLSVKSGLKAGDLVVYQGIQKLRDGMKVIPKTVKYDEIMDKIKKTESNNSKSKNKRIGGDFLTTQVNAEDDTSKIMDFNKMSDKENKNIEQEKIKPVKNDKKDSVQIQNIEANSNDLRAGKFRNGSEDSAIEKEIKEGDKQIIRTSKNIKKIEDEGILTTKIKGRNKVKTIDANELNNLPTETQKSIQDNIQAQNNLQRTISKTPQDNVQ
jgi:membrane fusion protein, multidrug efflux system